MVDPQSSRCLSGFQTASRSQRSFDLVQLNLEGAAGRRFGRATILVPGSTGGFAILVVSCQQNKDGSVMGVVMSAMLV